MVCLTYGQLAALAYLVGALVHIHWLFLFLHGSRRSAGDVGKAILWLVLWPGRMAFVLWEVWRGGLDEG